MGKIFCLMGKSATGKDTIYRELLNRKNVNIKNIVPYTTRPMRDGEEQGREYFFCTPKQVEELEAQGKIIELRAYNTVYGIWEYFTVDDGQIELDQYSYLLIGTLEMYLNVRQYFGAEAVLPIYIEVDDGERLTRALNREKEQDEPKYAELCRRFLADDADFSEDKLVAAGVTKRFENRNLNTTIEMVEAYIRQEVESLAD